MNSVMTIDNCRCKAEYIHCLCSGYKMWHVVVFESQIQFEDYLSGEQLVLTLIGPAEGYHSLENC